MVGERDAEHAADGAHQKVAVTAHLRKVQFVNQVIGTLKIPGKTCVRWSELEVKDKRRMAGNSEPTYESVQVECWWSPHLSKRGKQTHLNGSVVGVEKGTGAEGYPKQRFPVGPRKSLHLKERATTSFETESQKTV